MFSSLINICGYLLMMKLIDKVSGSIPELGEEFTVLP
tara:strand:- start:2131 stop:2241 length:111 start_codon:yes stop_codon:yes gene_type:complete